MKIFKLIVKPTGTGYNININSMMREKLLMGNIKRDGFECKNRQKYKQSDLNFRERISLYNCGIFGRGTT